jgi:hypothetical protein
LVAVELAPAMRAARDGTHLVAIVGVGGVANALLPADAILPSPGPAAATIALALMIAGLFTVRWAIVMLPHREFAVGPAVNRDGSP